MQFIWTIISREFYFYFSSPLIQILVWCVCLVLTILSLNKLKSYNTPINQALKKFLLIIIIIIPFTTLFIGFEINNSNLLPLPFIPITSRNVAMILIFIPIFAAGIYAGPFFATIIAFISGMLYALFTTHNPFTVWLFVAEALIFASLMRQNYGVQIYNILRKPFFTSLFMLLIYPILEIIVTILFVSGPLAVRIDYVYANFLIDWQSFAISLFIAYFLTQIIKWFLPQLWITPRSYQDTPDNLSIARKLYLALIPTMLLLWALLGFVDWYLTGNQTEELMRNELQNQAEIAAKTIPQILETGQTLILNYAQNDQFLFDNQKQTEFVFEQLMSEIPFFNNLFLLNEKGQPIAGYPESDIYKYAPSAQEENAIILALNDVPFQIYPVSPIGSSQSTQLSFITPVFDENGVPYRVLVGRASLDNNPYSQSLLEGFHNIEEMGGTSILLTPQNRVIYHTNKSELYKIFDNSVLETIGFSEGIRYDGIRQTFYHHIVQENGWHIINTMNTYISREMALRSFAPRFLLMVASFTIIFFLVRNVTNRTTSSLGILSSSAENIALGEFENSVDVKGKDEIGQLAEKFEQMRLRLQNAKHENDALMNINQYIGYDNDMKGLADLILEASQIYGAEASRLVIYPEQFVSLLDMLPTSYHKGRIAPRLESVDKQLILRINQDEIQIIDNISSTGLTFEFEVLTPEKIVIAKIMKNNMEYGFLWLAYYHDHQISTVELKFLQNLAIHASLAIEKTILTLEMNKNNKLLSTVINSHPDTMFLINNKGDITLMNESASSLLEVKRKENLINIEQIQVIKDHPRLYYMFHGNPNKQDACEIQWSDGKIYHVNIVRIESEEQGDFGWICTIKDISEYRLLDIQRISYLQSITNDLRRPIEIIHDNTSMLIKNGNLKENQKQLIEKVRNESSYLNYQIENLLNFNRLESGFTLEQQPISLLPIIQNILLRLNPEIVQKNIKLDLPELANPISINADENLLKIALYNVLENAVKFSYRNGKIKINILEEVENSIISIEDQGIGITPLDCDRIFNPFYQVDIGNEKDNNFGLGLSTAKMIIEKHNGTISVKSKLGEGSIFTIKVPKFNK